jgi:hypothetical protein
LPLATCHLKPVTGDVPTIAKFCATRFHNRNMKIMSNSCAHHTSKPEEDDDKLNTIVNYPSPRQQLPQLATSSSSSSWTYSYWKEQLDTFEDAQRMDRLAKCLQLDQVLKDCRQRQRNGSSNHWPTEGDPLESISPGLRTMKYFGWRGILKSKAAPGQSSDEATAISITEEDDDDDARIMIQKIVRQSCSREQHAVWACRAVATGCGKELASLKRCFEQQPHSYDVLAVPHTGYDTRWHDSPTHTIPCFQVQQLLGSCVTLSGQRLLRRKQQREAAAESSASNS